MPPMEEVFVLEAMETPDETYILGVYATLEEAQQGVPAVDEVRWEPFGYDSWIGRGTLAEEYQIGRWDVQGRPSRGHR